MRFWLALPRSAKAGRRRRCSSGIPGLLAAGALAARAVCADRGFGTGPWPRIAGARLAPL